MILRRRRQGEKGIQLAAGSQQQKTEIFDAIYTIYRIGIYFKGPISNGPIVGA